MSLQKAVANALSFAHLAGIGRTNPKATAAAEEDEDKKDAKASEDDDDEEKPDDKKKDAKAESDDDKKDDDEDKEKSKAEAHAAGHAAGVQAERARTAAVMGNPASANNIALAAELLCNSSMSADAIVSALGASAPRRSAGTSLHERMAKAETETPKAKADCGATGGAPTNLAARLTAIATERARAAGEIK